MYKTEYKEREKNEAYVICLTAEPIWFDMQNGLCSAKGLGYFLHILQTFLRRQYD